MKFDPAIVEFALWNTSVHGPQDRLILLAVGRWRRIWKEVTPSVKYIASEVGVSERQTRTILARLAKAGLITITNRRSKGSQGTNKYDIDPNGCIACVPEHRLATLRILLQNTDCTPCSLQTAQPAPKTRTREHNKQEHLRDHGSVSDWCEKIFDAYPRRIGRGRAIEKITSALDLIASEKKITTTEAAAWLLAKVQEYAASPAGKRGKFTPHPSTWFYQERYMDDPIEWKRGDITRQNSQPADESTWGDADEHFTGIEVG